MKRKPYSGMEDVHFRNFLVVKQKCKNVLSETEIYICIVSFSTISYKELVYDEGGKLDDGLGREERVDLDHEVEFPKMHMKFTKGQIRSLWKKMAFALELGENFFFFF